MSKSNEANWQAYFKMPNPGLESYFDKVRRGNSTEYRTTFYRGKSLEQVLAGWAPTLESIENKWPTLASYENDLKAKVGPLSIQKPLSERMDDIGSYYDSISLESVPISKSAEAAVIREWNAARGAEPRSQKAVVDLMKKSTNSGCPYFRRRASVVEETVPVRLTSTVNGIIQNLNGEEWFSTAILGWRGQEGGPTDEDVKQRVVWMFPFGVNICELQVYQPLIEMAQRYGLVPAWIGSEAVDLAITKMFDSKAPNDLVVCTDFSKFDQHFNADMQNSARNILSQILNRSENSRRWLSEVFPVKYNIPIAIDMDRILTGPHGMGSGSGGTNFDETLTHRALQYEAAQLNKAKLNPYSQCLGDDGVLTYPGITVDDVVRVYSSHGQEMNTDKQYASKHDLTYLRRWHHTDYRVNGICVGVYSTFRALGRLCEQERFYDPDVWGPKMVALRQLSIIENCKYHPLREQFVEYCMKGDKYRLGIDIPGFLDNITHIAEEAIEVMPDFLGYTKSLEKSDRAYGIANWWIVKYLKSK